jgi:acyl-CoA hydrolase
MSKSIPQKLIPRVEAKKRHRLTDMQVQMARELGMNPKKLGKIDNHKQEPWKAPLPQFIEGLYRKRFNREKPEHVLTLG